MFFNPRENNSSKLSACLDSAVIGLGIFGESVSQAQRKSSTEKDSGTPNISSGA